MPTVKNVDWVVCKRCEESESPSDVGIRLPDGELCWAHAFEAFTKEPDSKAAADFRAALDRLGAPEASLDARGVAVTAELLKLMIGAAWKEDYKPVLKDAQFIRANFHDPRGHKFSFEGVIFEGSTSFRKAIFKEGADFTGAEFRARVEFIEVNFEHNAWFPKAIFQDNAFFAAAIFKRLAWFERTVFMKMAAFDSRTPQDGAIMTTPGMDSATFLGEANFDDATFTEAHFDGVGFEAEVRFDKTNFELAGWNRASFNGYPVVFQHATFEKESSFDNSVFANEADFTGARFKKWAWFGGSVFKKSALFDEADFGEMANSEEMYHLHNLNISSVERTRVPETGFDHAVFQGIVGFAKAAFKNKTTFCGTSFQSEARFDEVTFQRELVFDRATFADRAYFSLAGGGQRVSLRRASFAERVTLTVATDHLDCTGSKFLRGANLGVTDSQMLLDEAEFGSPSLVGASASSSADQPTKRPRLLSLRRADTANLVLADVDLAACRFVGARHLDQLGLEGDFRFAFPPPGLRWGWAWPPVSWWTRRRTVADEYVWRQTQFRSKYKPKWPGWYPAECQPAVASTQESEQVLPADVARVYRDLRKSYEDRKYEPGAGDFYYGEMEMRRHDRETSVGERFVLWLYWLVSGYALRATRALVALLVVILAAAVVFASVGFIPANPLGSRLVGVSKEGTLQYERHCVYGELENKVCANRPGGWRLFQKQFPEALAFSAESTTSLLRTPQRSLYAVGEWTEVVLRLLGVLLFGLAVLSLRGRVKR